MKVDEILSILKPKRTVTMKKPIFAKGFTIFGLTLFIAFGKTTKKKYHTDELDTCDYCGGYDGCLKGCTAPCCKK